MGVRERRQGHYTDQSREIRREDFTTLQGGERGGGVAMWAWSLKNMYLAAIASGPHAQSEL